MIPASDATTIGP